MCDTYIKCDGFLSEMINSSFYPCGSLLLHCTEKVNSLHSGKFIDSPPLDRTAVRISVANARAILSQRQNRNLCLLVCLGANERDEAMRAD